MLQSQPLRRGAVCRRAPQARRARAVAASIYCSAKPEVVERFEASTSEASHSGNTLAHDTQPATGRKHAVFRATKLGRQPVVEKQRPLAEYMCLPASQYSVLDGRKVERIDANTFRCYVGQLKFLSWEVEPVITVSVEVEPQEQGCTIRLLGCRLQGSRFVEDINDRFTATMTNVVRCRDFVPPAEEQDSDGEEAGAGAEAGPSKQISSETTIQVTAEVPSWCGFLPVPSIESAGSGVVQGVLNAMVPRFLEQLRADYELWASGDDSRRPVGEL